MMEAKTVPLTRLREIGDEDKDTMCLLIDLFLKQTPELLQNITDCSNNVDSIATKNAAHTLKGVCMNLGFEEMGTICTEIEQQALSSAFADINKLLEKLHAISLELSKDLTALKEEA